MNTTLPLFALIRDYKPEATLGTLYFDGKEVCKILERPKVVEGKQNSSDDPNTKFNESCCIPEGDYLVQDTMSFKFKKMMYQITGVNGRDGIRIHCANWVSELLGCLATATRIEEQKAEGDQKYKAIGSQDAMKKFLGIAPEKFKLKITSKDSICNVSSQS